MHIIAHRIMVTLILVGNDADADIDYDDGDNFNMN